MNWALVEPVLYDLSDKGWALGEIHAYLCAGGDLAGDTYDFFLTTAERKLLAREVVAQAVNAANRRTLSEQSAALVG